MDNSIIAPLNRQAPSLRVDQVSVRYPHASQSLITNLSFELKPGMLLSILGPNGCGKSTLLRTLTGMLTPFSGQIILGEQPLKQMSAKQRAQQMAYVPQMGSTVYDYTVEEYLIMGYASTLGLLRRPSEKERQGVRDVLQSAGLAALAHKSITYLSGGERQMVSIARALLQRAPLIILDEPTSALDLGNQMRVLEMIARLHIAGYSVIMTTHSPDHALLLEGHALLIDAQGTYVMGSAAEVVTSSRLSAVYKTPLIIEQAVHAQRSICVAKRLNPDESWAFEVSNH